MRYAETGYNLEIDLSRGNIARPAILKMPGGAEGSFNDTNYFFYWQLRFR